ncbi:MAG: sensor domain-containing diguanylate cyclase [Desulfovibrio sp.]|uniref:sensor domain-containing diguanylate cyclase n=1 Tax=Desulfovibrio sp. TaxID=885 RepID=UPI0039E4AFD6
MKEFLSYCPLEGLAPYLESVEKILNGSQGPHLELIYPLGKFMVRAQMMVLQRDVFGRGTILVGTLTAIDRQEIEPVVMPVMNSRPLISSPTPKADASRLLLALNAAGDGLWDWDPNAGTIYYSPRYLEILGYTNETFPHVAESWIKRIHPDDFDKIVPLQMEIVSSPEHGDSFECTYRMLRADGKWAWVLARGYVTHRDANGKATRLVGLHTDVTASQGDRARLEDLVRNDALTGLRSRAYYGMTVNRLEQQKVRPVSVLICDMDGLKLINDHLGHHEGSKMLCQAALILRDSLSAVDCIARMGGDEFAAILPECSQSELESAIARIKSSFEAHNTNSDNIPTRMAIGGACAEDMNTSLDELLVISDRQMLCAKLEGRTTWREHVKNWIETRTDKIVQLEDCRYM